MPEEVEQLSYASGPVARELREDVRLGLCEPEITKSLAQVETDPMRIQHVAAAGGVPEKYNETVSRFWVRIVAHAMERSSSQAGFEPLVEAHPALLDKELPLRHWSPAVLWSDLAKREWVEPDVCPIPFG